MNDLELIAELHKLGLDADSFRAIALLPLIEVAWVDRAVQAQERKSILLIARAHKLLEGAAANVVENWLSTRPTDETFKKGREILGILAHRKSGLGADMPEHITDTVVELCSVVAESAGGLFGVFFTVSTEERRAIHRIAEHLNAIAEAEAGPRRGIVGRTLTGTWLGVLEDLETDEVPAPEPSKPS
jgi:tellurite resistance protein